MSEQAQEKPMTEEEAQKLIEEHRLAWEAFFTNLKNNPTVPVTNADLVKTIEFLAEDMGGMGQMIKMIGSHLGGLENRFQHLMTALGAKLTPAKTTKSGIILPNG